VSFGGAGAPVQLELVPSELSLAVGDVVGTTAEAHGADRFEFGLGSGRSLKRLLLSRFLFCTFGAGW
jgi:hypothetical protein